MADQAATDIAQTPQQRQAVQLVQTRKDRAERLHRPYRDRWNDQYGQYHCYRKSRQQVAQAGTQNRGDRDGVLLDLKREWGAELRLPMAYAAVETIVPRAIANMPRITARPNDQGAADAADRVAKVMNRQQEAINYEMILQPTARRGFIHGLGVQKTYWEKRVRNLSTNTPRRIRRGYKTTKKDVTIYEGPQAEDVDIFDFFWDPGAKDIRTCEWVIHRTWRSQDYVAKQIRSDKWGKAFGEKFELDIDKLKGLISDQSAADAWGDRMMAGGYGTSEARKGPYHEVWEYHDREQVITVLDRKILVQQDVNPSFYGELPFQIFRPTLVAGEFVGKGSIEPIAHLISELDRLRSNRLDGALLALNPPFFYTQGLLTQTPVFGPGVFNPVLGDPNEVIKQIQLRDIPNSGYQEADEIKQDMDRALGISDPVAGAEAQNASQATATGIQLIQSAASVRIKLQARNLMKETVKPAACEFFWLNRQHMLEDKTVRIDGQDGGYEFVNVTQKDWWSNLDIIPDADSTEPDNPPERKANALTALQALAPFIGQAVDPAKAIVWFLRENSVSDPESWIMQQPPPTAPGGAAIDPTVLGEILKQSGVQENVALGLIQQALQASQPQGGQQPAPQSNGATAPAPTGG